MGDRNNPIKFGPEWLRNYRQRNSSNSNNNNPNNTSGSSSSTNATSSAAAGQSTGIPAPGPSRENQSTSARNSRKVLLAKLRYGREEMLALYDRNTEPPQELKKIEFLFQDSSMPPSALNTSFDERDTIRNVPPTPSFLLGERFPLGRGYMGRGAILEVRGRSRSSFLRQQPGAKSSWQMGNPRMVGYNPTTEEELQTPLRPWNNNNASGSTSGTRNNNESSEWQTSKVYKGKRAGSNSNWRQVSREEGEEWRADMTRSKSQDKWGSGDKPAVGDKSQTWNRRTWVGNETSNKEDNLPEWAVDNAGACGGTFDSSGAFHGYSNDDSNLPKTQETTYPLTRSHTQGSFIRPKTVDEGSEEWWASEKAKKLSPKRFDAGDIKFKKPPPPLVMPEASNSGTNKSNVNKNEVLEKDPYFGFPYTPEADAETKAKCVEPKTFEAIRKASINLEKEKEDQGNFQSVMIKPKNCLRQKHQNIVLPSDETAGDLNRYHHGILYLQVSSSSSTEDSLDVAKTSEDKIVDDLMDLKVDEKTPKTTVAPSTDVAVPKNILLLDTSVPPPSRNVLPNMIPTGLQNQPINMPMNQNNVPIGIMPPIGITNSALNASLGLPIGGSNLGIPLTSIPPPVLPSPGMDNTGYGIVGNSLQGGLGAGKIPAGPTGMEPPNFANPLSHMSATEVGNNSLFMGQNSNNSSKIQTQNGIQMPNNANQNMFSVHNLQHSASHTGFSNSLYRNLIPPPQNPSRPTAANDLSEQWYYEDPKKMVQGPFAPHEMFSWYQAGFFTSTLMVRRATETVMRPLGSYGPIVPFAQLETMPYYLSGDNMCTNQQSAIGLGATTMNNLNMNMPNNNPVNNIQFGSVGMMPNNPPFGQNPMAESLWGQPSTSTDIMWMQQNNGSKNENHVNSLPMYFWDQQPTAMSSNSLLPEGITKEMKTEDQILAQLRVSQNISTSQTLSFIADQQRSETTIPIKSDEKFIPPVNATPDLEELQKIIQSEALASIPLPPLPPLPQLPLLPPQSVQTVIAEQIKEKRGKPDSNVIEAIIAKSISTKPTEIKAAKQVKSEIEKVSKKTEKVKGEKIKKVKEEKKDEPIDTKVKEKIHSEKRSEEPSPSKNKKEEKVNKKDLEREKKEWMQEGFTIVKGPEKNVNKDNKKKAEELKAAEELDRKKKEAEIKIAGLEEKKKNQLEAIKRQQEQDQQQLKKISELVMKKAPWSAVSNQAIQSTNKDGLTLAEIQRLEREKKLEQMKEQQHMMQIIAQQQAAALAREQEMQAGLGWAKKKSSSNIATHSLAEIQNEARKQIAAAATAATMATGQPLDDTQLTFSTSINHMPWGNSHNDNDLMSGFWDTQPHISPKPEKPIDSLKLSESTKTKKKMCNVIPTKKDTSPVAEFENWCSVELTAWSSKIDVPTFVGFLKDIESPYEVKDYVKCYLGESKDSSDFARQFLERRSKLLRVGMVTPSDDLCSPAIAINPRANSNSDYQEVKSKGKKIKKNKMLKVDARILGFSVTAAEDRINVGDIDTA